MKVWFLFFLLFTTKVDSFASSSLSQSESIVFNKFKSRLPKLLTKHLPHHIQYKPTDPSADIEFGKNWFFTRTNKNAYEIYPDPTGSYLYSMQEALIFHLVTEWQKENPSYYKSRWLEASGWKSIVPKNLAITKLLFRHDNHSEHGFNKTEGSESPKKDFISYAIGYFVSHSKFSEFNIACLWPNRFAYFAKIFPENRHLSDSCSHSTADITGRKNFHDLVTGLSFTYNSLKAEQVEGFELLYATPGTSDPAEVAGHIILRVLLKQDQAFLKGDFENPRDIVISFLADTRVLRNEKKKPIQDPEKLCKERTTSWFNEILGRRIADQKDEDPLAGLKQIIFGLTGGFLTFYESMTLEQTIRSYAEDQDRTLERYRLLLTESQKIALLKKLELSRLKFKTPYYFFHRNCASILLQIIGEGLEKEGIASFRPVVAPPKSLLALLDRNNLIRRVYPSFYSGRKKAQAALNILKIEHNIRSSNEIEAMIQKFEKQKIKSLSDSDLEKLSLISNAARISKVSGDICDIQFNKQEQKISKLFRKVALANPSKLRKATQTADSKIHDLLVENEKEVFQGRKNTGLLELELGTKYGRFQDIDTSFSYRANYIGFSLFEEQMGTNDKYAMQRGSEVTLGRFFLGRSSNQENSEEATFWEFEGLSIEKFRDNLGNIPPYLSEHGGIGIGIQVIDLVGMEDQYEGTLLGGHLLFNIYSSHYHKNHLFSKIGLTIDRKTGKIAESKTFITLPIQFKMQFYFGEGIFVRGKVFFQVTQIDEENTKSSAALELHKIGLIGFEGLGSMLSIGQHRNNRKTWRSFQLALNYRNF